MTVTTKLCETFKHRKFNEIPATVIDEARRLVLDSVGVTISGSQSETGRIAGDFARELAGPAEATLIGQSGKVSAVHAAFANAISAHSLELDDVDEDALLHFGPPIVPTALALAERCHRSGEELLTAVVAGCETMIRLSRSVNPSLRDRGFHTTPTCGVFGAAMTSGLLLDLSEEQLVSALGLAGAQASGLMEFYGTSMQKRFNPGPSARNGVTAALMAQSGFTGADSIIEGERGFARAFADSYDEERLLDGLGEETRLCIEYKPYSCARPIHTAIDCALELRTAHGVAIPDVKSITVYRHPAWANFHQIARPRSYHEAQMSLPYSVAVALAEGKALPAQYERADTGGDAAVMSLSGLVKFEQDATLARGVSCRMVIETNDGRELEAHVDYPKGSMQRPLTVAEMEEKFTSLAEPVVGDTRTEDLIASIKKIEALDDVAAFCRALSVG